MPFEPPDPELDAAMAECFRPHFRTLVGLMAQKDVRFLPVEGESHHGIPFVALIAQGPHDVGILRQVAERVAAILAADSRDSSEESRLQ